MSTKFGKKHTHQKEKGISVRLEEQNAEALAETTDASKIKQ
jgi:hypothetical protein